jgi:hypothetical protein
MMITSLQISVLEARLVQEFNTTALPKLSALYTLQVLPCDAPDFHHLRIHHSPS